MSDEIKINGKAIYTTKGAAKEYGRIGCNFYTGCPHNCAYCYLKRGAPSKQLGGTEVRLKKCLASEERALEIFCDEARRHIDALQRYGIFFSFTTDPMIPETRSLTFSALNFTMYNGIRAKVLTKDATFITYKRMVLNMKSNTAKELVEFGFTLTGRDDMEPNASCNHDRIEAMHQLHDNGFKIFASIEPVIDWQHARMVIDLSLDCCDHYKIGLRSGVRKDYYDLLSSGMNIRELTEEIVRAGRTVYLKESTRALLRRCFKEEECNRILGLTVDMDGNRIDNLKKEISA
ncbi:MAG: hypothetical protein J5732_02910 [Bacteroidaceae bacterium]|nr:hypothetical protein [Bacteroidaceae bacterium]